jgi:cytosine deaminase
MLNDPATDLLRMGRGRNHSIPRGAAPPHRLLDLGVNCSLATDNVLNPFTPFGDGSRLRIAHPFANAALNRPKFDCMLAYCAVAGAKF